MKPSILSSLLIALSLFSSPSAWSAAKGYQLYAFPALIVSAKTQTTEGAVDNPLISPEWNALYQRNLSPMNDQFVSAIRSGFPDLVTEKILKEDRDRSLVVSLHIARARHYSVPKPNGTQDVYVPVTGSLYFTNPKTTEVVLAFSTTVKPIQTLPQGDVDFSKRVEVLYQKGYEALLGELIAQAKGRFSPTVISTTVVQTQLGLGITSIGTGGGLAVGDKLYSQVDDVPLTVVSCEETACVAKRVVGDVPVGATYTKRSSGKVSALDKPSVYVDVKSSNPSLDVVWGLLFAENLGERAPFNVVFFNPDFQYLLDQISAQNQISRDDIEKRDPPELVLQISLDEPLSYKLPTNLSYKFAAGFVGRATAKIVDRNSNLVFSKSVVDVIEDEITEGVDFSAEDRAEISAKNALIALAETMSADFKPSVLSFPISRKGAASVTSDPGRLLRMGQKYTIYRPIKSASSSVPLLVPIGHVKPARGAGEEKVLELTPPSIAVHKFEVLSGDVLLVRNAVSKSLSSDSTIAVCGVAENRGQVELQNMHEKIFTGISRKLSHPFLVLDGPESVAFMFGGESGFRALTKRELTQQGPSDFCIQPIQRIEPAERICKKDVCQVAISVKLGASLVKDGASLAVKAVEQKVTTPGFSQSASAADQASAIKASAERELVKPAFEAAIQQQIGNQN
jgi:hypothetical protein